jgi:hypothetical protein
MTVGAWLLLGSKFSEADIFPIWNVVGSGDNGERKSVPETIDGSYTIDSCDSVLVNLEILMESIDPPLEVGVFLKGLFLNGLISLYERASVCCLMALLL